MLGARDNYDTGKVVRNYTQGEWQIPRPQFGRPNMSFPWMRGQNGGTAPPMARGNPRQDETVDSHELLKTIAFKARSSACDEHFEKSRPCPSEVHGVSDQYVILDSVLSACPSSSAAKGVYKFNFAVQHDSGEQFVGVRDTMDTIIQIQTFPFCMALPLTVDPDVPTGSANLTTAINPGPTDPRGLGNPVTGSLSQLAHCPRVTLYFNELGLQSHADFKRRRHHFEYTATVEGTVGNAGARMLLTPVNNIFVFTEPIQDISALTCQFYGPDEPLRFPQDVIKGVTLATRAGGDIEIIGPATLEDGTALDFTSLLVPGDRIFLDNVNLSTSTAGPADIAPAAVNDVPAIENYLGKADGLFVGANITADRFDLDPAPTPTNIAVSTAIIESTTITLRIAKNRMRAPFRLRRVVKRLTNYISP